MSRRRADGAYGKALDLWQAPEHAGEPLVCIATTYTFDATFFETECIGRFLQMDAHPSESGSIAYLVEREEKLAGARVHALVDRRHARDKESLRWDIIGVLVPRAVQHAKLAVLAWKDCVRVIIGSGNLTEPGYRKNVEVFGTVELSREEGGHRTTLTATLDFLEELAGFGVGTVDPATPKERLRDSIRQVRQHVRAWPLQESRSDSVPVFNSPTRSAIRHVEELWPANSPPREAYIVSPFFDHPPNDGRAADSLKALLAKRGETITRFYVKTEPLLDGRTRIYAPKRIAESESAGAGRTGIGSTVPESSLDDRRRSRQTPAYRRKVEVYPLLVDQHGEPREVHSKLLSLGNEQWRLLMIGSSNFTAAGLGVTSGKGNFEANLVYRFKTSNPLFKQLDCIWPDAGADPVDLDATTLIWDPCFEDDEDGAGTCPLPASFEEALFDPGPPGSLKLTLTDPLPTEWSIRVPAGRILLTSANAAGVYTIPWDQDPSPFVLEVTWHQVAGDPLVASWPVNVSNPAALPPPEALRGLSLEELLEILASTHPLPEAVWRALEKRHKGRSRDPGLDPLRRLDSQAFLLRRTKRVARALDRLRERLERPALTKDAFEWRLRGPVGPMTLADAFVKEATLAGEAKFCLAELALTLRRADPKAAAQGGLAADVIRACIRDAIRGIESRAAALESSTATAMLDAYVTAAFLEATAE